MPRNFRDLIVWERSHELTLGVYRATAHTSRRDHGALVSQLRRAAASVPANIAEGCGRGSRRDLARFLQIAMASATELEYHLVLAHDLTAINRSAHDVLIDQTTQVKRMLTVLIRRIREEERADG